MGFALQAVYTQFQAHFVPSYQLLASVARTELDNIANQPTRTTATIGYDYFLSKRADLYANLMNDRLTSYKNGASLGVGMRHRF